VTRRLQSIVGLVLLTAMWSCARPEPLRPDVVKVAIWPAISYAPLYIAQDEGLFAELGLEVELVRLPGTAAIPALARGQVDVVGNMQTAGVYNAILAGSPIRVVADKGHDEPGPCSAEGILIGPRLTPGGVLPPVSSLKGATAFVLEGQIQEYFVEKLLATGGLTLADVTVRYVPPAAKGEALRVGQIDLLPYSEPELTRNVSMGRGRLYRSVTDVTPRLQWAYLLFGRSLLQDRPDVGERFIAAYLQGVRRFSAGKTDRNIGIIAAHTEMPEDLLRQACWPTIREDGRIDGDSVMAFQEWAVSRGYLKAVVPLEQLWETRFVDAAAAKLAADGS